LFLQCSHQYNKDRVKGGQKKEKQGYTTRSVLVLLIFKIGGFYMDEQKSPKGFVPALILCILLGGLGVHRFYVGKVGTGIVMILTFGGLGIWTLIDLIMIAVGNFKDSNGLPIKP
tara:strand:+ start:55 stop:399 length:345 start_codon:yes stop_codon:yes gene_type:complete